jgi:S1-C subfamily serine protease
LRDDAVLSTNISYRIAKICGVQQGTGFIVDQNNVVFVITAKHVVEHVSVGSKLEIALRHWRGSLLVHAKRDYGDVCAILVDVNNIFAPFECVFDIGGLLFAQEVFLIGFPFGWEQSVTIEGKKELNPFVKKAIFSNMGDGDTFYVDTRVNPGFSGAPVVFYSPKDRMPHVAGVVSAYCKELDGFSVCYHIKLASMAIEDILADIGQRQR